MKDEELIERYLNGDDHAFELLVRRYLKPIYSFVFRFVNNVQEAEDITQEIFLKVWRNLKKFKKEKNFKTWIFTIAKNSTIDFLKKKKKIFAVDFIEKIEDGRSLPDKVIQENELLGLLNQSLKNLPDQYQLVLTLHYDNNLTFREISQILEKPLNTVKSIHRRALILLRQSFKNNNLLLENER